MNYSPEIIGNKIKEQRSKKKWSQETLGKKLNMSGKAKKYFADNTVIGNVTVTLTPME